MSEKLQAKLDEKYVNCNVKQVIIANVILLYGYFKQRDMKICILEDGKLIYNQDFSFWGTESLQDLSNEVATINVQDKVFDLTNIKATIDKDKNGKQYFSIICSVDSKIIVIKSLLYNTVTIYNDMDLKSNLLLVFKQINCDRTAMLKEFDVLTENQQDQILNDFSGKKVEINKEDNLVGIFQQNVEKYPDNIAVVFEDINETYDELNRKSNQIANYLLEQGLKKEDLVAVIMERSNLMMELILGIWKAGGAYVPVNKSYPLERIKDIVSDADPYFIVHSFDEGSEKREAYADKNCIHLDDLLTDAKLCSDSNVCEIESSNQLAYVLYTSGSTGKSKGVMIEHIGMLNHMYSKIIDLELSKKSVIAQNASHCFDISVWQFFVSLLLGGTTVVISEEVILDLFDFFDELSRNQVTILEVVPSYLEPIIDFFSEEDPDYSIMNSIEAIIVTGEKFNKKLADNWFNLFPDIKMVNAYGPTEASDDITHHILYESPKEDFVTIGHAINNMNIYILDNDLKLCPIGVIGEICVAGIGVGRGYINMPEKTKEVFIKNPFGKRAVRLYRTGDYGKWMNQGNIEFVGRKDEQVKVRGFRIELGDVKNILLKHPEIDNVVVLCKENEMAEKKICAYIKSFRKIDRNELNSFFCQYAPRYMLPNEYKFIESFPLTSNGKIDVRALRTF